MEPLAREVFAGHWTGKSRTRMHSHVLLASCEHFRARRCRCDSICDPLEFEPLIFDGWFNLKLAQVIEGFSGWFRGYSGLVQKLFEGYSIQGWCVGYFEPFSFFFSFWLFFIIFPPLPSKLTLEIVKRSFFSNPFRVFSLFFLFWLFFLLCLPNPWKLSKTLFLEPFSFCFVFVVYFSFFRFDYFSSFAFKP